MNQENMETIQSAFKAFVSAFRKIRKIFADMFKVIKEKITVMLLNDSNRVKVKQLLSISRRTKSSRIKKKVDLRIMKMVFNN